MLKSLYIYIIVYINSRFNNRFQQIRNQSENDDIPEKPK